MLGIVLPILWDAYKTKTSLEIREVSRAVVASANADLDGLRFVYGGKLVSSLSRVEVEIKNSGRTPIRAEDVVSPLSIQFSGQVIDFEIKRRKPQDLDVKFALGDKPGQLLVGFPLLNPGDATLVSVLFSTDRPKVGATARIAGLKELSFVSSVKDVSLQVKSQKDWIFYVVGVFTVFSILMALAAAHVYGKERIVGDSIRKGLLSIPWHGDKDDFLTWREKVPSGFKESELNSVESMWSSGIYEDSDVLTANRKLFDGLTSSQGIKGVSYMFGFLSLVGIAYLAFRLW